MIDPFIEEHKEIMRARLKTVIAHNRSQQWKQTRKFRDLERHKLREQRVARRGIHPDILAIIQPIAEEYGVTVRQLAGGSQRDTCCAARKASIGALYKAFPGKPLEWYGRPFGYQGSGGASHHLRSLGLLPPLNRKEKLK